MVSIVTPHFLWFNLTEPNLWISLIAAIVYFFQPLVNSRHYPKDQRTSYYVFNGIYHLFFITYISLHSAAALGLYWTVGGLFLIIPNAFRT
ncbi:lipoprotein precursor [Staphylococcus gallinarum]|uniref:Lipoprotein n=1 Tax=Staphylococcus gallinarum TaxID=1293 RepID=A0A380FM22_STAGA|nr:lipoprotein precursor [Staphylococcus gallinarum]